MDPAETAVIWDSFSFFAATHAHCLIPAVTKVCFHTVKSGFTLLGTVRNAGYQSYSTGEAARISSQKLAVIRSANLILHKAILYSMAKKQA